LGGLDALRPGGWAAGALAATAAFDRMKLLQLGISEKLPSQIVACKFNLTPEIRRQVLEEAPHITWDFGEAKCGFIAADDAAFQNLRDLLKPRNPAAPSPVKPVMPRTAQANPKPIKRP
jgi:hypothetical protein